MSRWREVKFGEVVELSQGLAINMQSKHLQTNDETQLPLLRIADMKEGTKSRYISKEVNEKFVAKPEDIIYTRTGQVGLVFKGQNGVIHNNCFKVMPCEKTVNRDFLYWILKSNYMYSYVNILASGAAQPDLTHSKFKNIKIQIPDLETQKKIADILSTYDELIENNNRRIEILEKTAEEIYKEWFVRMRFPGHENTRFEKGIPEGWEEVKLEDICNLVRGISYSTKEVEKDLGIAMLTLKSVNAYGGYNYDGLRFYDGKISDRHYIKKNDLIMAITDMTQDRRVIGQVCLVPRLHYEELVFSADLILLDDLKIEKSYMYSLLRYGGISRYISTFSNGANVLHLNQRTLNNIRFYIAPEKLRIDYDKIHVDIQDKINNLQLQNQNLAKQRDLLLPRLMNGTIEVK